LSFLLAQVTPLVDVLLIPADVASYLRGCSMLLVVGLQLLALRQLVQVRHDMSAQLTVVQHLIY
jgi:hypothetical protein